MFLLLIFFSGIHKRADIQQLDTRYIFVHLKIIPNYVEYINVNNKTQTNFELGNFQPSASKKYDAKALEITQYCTVHIKLFKFISVRLSQDYYLRLYS